MEISVNKCIGTKVRLSEEEFSVGYKAKLQEFLADDTKNPYLSLDKHLTILKEQKIDIVNMLMKCEEECSKVIKRQTIFLQKQGVIPRNVRDVGVNVNTIDSHMNNESGSQSSLNTTCVKIPSTPSALERSNFESEKTLPPISNTTSLKPPPRPCLTVIQKLGYVMLVWDIGLTKSHETIHNYEIHMQKRNHTEPGRTFEWTKLKEVMATSSRMSFKLIGLEGNTIYYYKVRAIDIYSQPGEFSNNVNISVSIQEAISHRSQTRTPKNDSTTIPVAPKVPVQKVPAGAINCPHDPKSDITELNDHTDNGDHLLEAKEPVPVDERHAKSSKEPVNTDRLSTCSNSSDFVIPSTIVRGQNSEILVGMGPLESSSKGCSKSNNMQVNDINERHSNSSELAAIASAKDAIIHIKPLGLTLNNSFEKDTLGMVHNTSKSEGSADKNNGQCKSSNSPSHKISPSVLNIEEAKIIDGSKLLNSSKPISSNDNLVSKQAESSSKSENAITVDSDKLKLPYTEETRSLMVPPKPCLTVVRLPTVAQLCWKIELDDKHAKVCKFEIHARKDDVLDPTKSFDWRKVSEVRSHEMSYNLPNLRANMMYHFKVRAVDTFHRMGELSNEVPISFSVYKSRNSPMLVLRQNVNVTPEKPETTKAKQIIDEVVENCSSKCDTAPDSKNAEIPPKIEVADEVTEESKDLLKSEGTPCVVQDDDKTIKLSDVLNPSDHKSSLKLIEEKDNSISTKTDSSEISKPNEIPTGSAAKEQYDDKTIKLPGVFIPSDHKSSLKLIEEKDNPISTKTDSSKSSKPNEIPSGTAAKEQDDDKETMKLSDVFIPSDHKFSFKLVEVKDNPVSTKADSSENSKPNDLPSGMNCQLFTAAKEEDDAKAAKKLSDVLISSDHKFNFKLFEEKDNSKTDSSENSKPNELPTGTAAKEQDDDYKGAIKLCDVLILSNHKFSFKVVEVEINPVSKTDPSENSKPTEIPTGTAAKIRWTKSSEKQIMKSVSFKTAKPPKPDLTMLKQDNSIQLTWVINSISSSSSVETFQLFWYEEHNMHPKKSTNWCKAVDLKALSSSMSCTLTQFEENVVYHFAITATDSSSKAGEFSNVVDVEFASVKDSSSLIHSSPNPVTFGDTKQTSVINKGPTESPLCFKMLERTDKHGVSSRLEQPGMNSQIPKTGMLDQRKSLCPYTFKASGSPLVNVHQKILPIENQPVITVSGPNLTQLCSDQLTSNQPSVSQSACISSFLTTVTTSDSIRYRHLQVPSMPRQPCINSQLYKSTLPGQCQTNPLISNMGNVSKSLRPSKLMDSLPPHAPSLPMVTAPLYYQSSLLISNHNLYRITSCSNISAGEKQSGVQVPSVAEQPGTELVGTTLLDKTNSGFPKGNSIENSKLGNSSKKTERKLKNSRPKDVRELDLGWKKPRLISEFLEPCSKLAKVSRKQLMEQGQLHSTTFSKSGLRSDSMKDDKSEQPGINLELPKLTKQGHSTSHHQLELAQEQITMSQPEHGPVASSMTCGNQLKPDQQTSPQDSDAKMPENDAQEETIKSSLNESSESVTSNDLVIDESSELMESSVSEQADITSQISDQNVSVSMLASVLDVPQSKSGQEENSYLNRPAHCELAQAEGDLQPESDQENRNLTRLAHSEVNQAAVVPQLEADQEGNSNLIRPTHSELFQAAHAVPQPNNSKSNKSSELSAAATNEATEDLFRVMNAIYLKLPPKPKLKASKQGTLVQLTWDMELDSSHVPLSNYELYWFEESLYNPSIRTDWEKALDIEALYMPMSCILTQLKENKCYTFAVRGKDILSRNGEFSNHVKVRLYPTTLDPWITPNMEDF